MKMIENSQISTNFSRRFIIFWPHIYLYRVKHGIYIKHPRCLDFYGKGMSDISLNTLQKLEINIEDCIGNSINGAANTQ